MNNNTDEIKNILLILNDNSISLNDKFRNYAKYSSSIKKEIIDVIDESMYSNFIDVFYRFGDELSNEIDYDLLRIAELIEIDCHNRRIYNLFVKKLELFVDTSISHYRQELLIMNRYKYKKNNTFFYFKDISALKNIISVESYDIREIRKDPIDNDELFLLLRLFLRNKYNFIKIPNNGLINVTRL